MLLKFVEDNNNDIYEAISPLLTDIMRIVSANKSYKKERLLIQGNVQYKKARKANENGYVLPQDKAQFFATLLETLVSQMQWPVDSEWDPADPGEEEDDDYEAFNQRRMVSLDRVTFTKSLLTRQAATLANTIGNRPDCTNRLGIDQKQDRSVCLRNVQPDPIAGTFCRILAAGGTGGSLDVYLWRTATNMYVLVNNETSKATLMVFWSLDSDSGTGDLLQYTSRGQQCAQRKSEGEGREV